MIILHVITLECDLHGAHTKCSDAKVVRYLLFDLSRRARNFESECGRRAVSPPREPEA